MRSVRAGCTSSSKGLRIAVVLLLGLTACLAEDTTTSPATAPSSPVIAEVHAHGDHDHFEEVVLPDRAAVASAFHNGVAHFDQPDPFKQVSFLIEADDLSAFEYRVHLGADSWSEWAPVEITWEEDVNYVGRVLLDALTHKIELRGGEQVSFALLEFHDEIIANLEVLTRDLEVETEEHLFYEFEAHEGDFRTVRQASVAPSSLVTSRSGWGARNPGKICGSVRAPYRMSIHHTASPSSDGGDAAARMRSMQAFHIDSRGWCDIGYHFVVAQSGVIYQGRSRSDRPGAHVGNQNAGNVGISFIANFGSQTPTNTQLNAGARIMRWVHTTHGVPLNRTSVKGHREWPGQSTSCPGNNMINKLNDLISRAKNGGSTPPPPPPPPPPPEPTYDADIEVKISGLENFYGSGSSSSLPDALAGDRFQAQILVTNRSSDPIRNVQVGYAIEQPFIKAHNYKIYTDHPAYNQQQWQVNDANDHPNNPPKDNMGPSGVLHLYAFSPGETKRIDIDVRVREYSIGRTDHPHVRGWVRNVDNVYTGHTNYGDTASTNLFNKVMRAQKRLDVLSVEEWQFDSKKHRNDTEGWTACYGGHHEELAHNTNHGLLSLKVNGDASCVQAPDWTQIQADSYDQLVIGVRSHDGDHFKALLWGSEQDRGALQFPCQEVDRASGADRYESSAAISQTLFPTGANTAVLVHGDRLVSDAIVAAPLANQLGGPVLLTSGQSLPDPIAAELHRLNANRVILIGGEFAITPTVEQTLRAMGLTVERRAGPTRYDTAVETALLLGAPTRTAIIVSGEDDNLVDGVVAAPLAAYMQAPILFVNAEEVPAVTAEALLTLNIAHTLVIGGTNGIPDSVMSALPNPTRLSGANRNQTAVAVATHGVNLGMSPNHVFIARGDNPLDAVSAAPAGRIILLTGTGGLAPVSSSFITRHASSATLIGGTAALSDVVERDTCHAFHEQRTYDNARAVRFRAPGDSEFHTLVVPVAGEPGWSGVIDRLRILPLHGAAPAADDSGWYDIQFIYLQNSTTRETSSLTRGFVDQAPVETLVLPQDEHPEPAPDPNDNDGPASNDGNPDRDTDDHTGGEIIDGSNNVAPSADGSMPLVQTNGGCSTASGQPATPVFLLVVGMMFWGVLSRRREVSVS